MGASMDASRQENRMASFLYHVLVGNDAHPAMVAAGRGFLAPRITGGLVALSTWSVTEVPKEIIIPSLTAFLTTFAVRVLGEGVVDSWKAGRKNGEGGTP